MKIHFLLPLFLLLSSTLFAQTFNVLGTVADTANAPMGGATVVLLNRADSVLITFGLSKEDGTFSLKKAKPGAFIVQVSYLGTYTMSEPVDVVDKDVTLAPFVMKPEGMSLGDVIIEGERTPIFIKKDTVEYTADAFKTQPDAVVEDLLKKLPGIEVDREGTITAMGEEVKSVLVDGKEFFGKDPKLATQNLPANAVDKVQVFDRKSDISEFTGIDDGNTEKAINLKLKEDKKKGIFGRVEGGYGTMDRYTGRASVNKFGKKSQISLLGLGNNTNDAGFSFSDYVNFMGGMSNLRGSGGRFRLNSGNAGIPIGDGSNNGLTNSAAGGLNVNVDISKKTKLTTSYLLNHVGTDLVGTTERIQFLPDNEELITNDSSEKFTRNTNHRLNLILRSEIDSFQQVIFRSSFNANDAFLEDNYRSSSVTRGFIANTGSQAYDSDGARVDGSGTLVYRRKFRKLGRSFALELGGGFQMDEQTGNLNSITFIEKAGTYDSLLQRQSQVDDQLNYNAKITYSEPLATKVYLELNYEHQNYRNDWARDIFDRVLVKEERNQFLSAEYVRDYLYHKGGFNIRRTTQKGNFTVGVALQQSNLKGDLVSLNEVIDKSFTNLLPSLNYDLDLSNSKNLRFSYNTRVREPSLEQLQPITNNTNPLNIYIGNPDLRPEYTHTVQARYRSFNQFNFSNLFGRISLTYTQNDITNATSIDSFFRQVSRPVNVDHQMRISGFVNYGTPIKIVNWRISLDANLSYTEGIVFVNEVQNTSYRFANTFGVKFENRKKEIFDINVGAQFTQSNTTYSEDASRKQAYLNQRYYVDALVNFAKVWRLGSSLDYDIYGGASFAESQSVQLWKAEFSRYFTKTKRLQVGVKVFDILNQNLGVNRSSELNYVEEETIRSLGRYGMVTMTWMLSKFGDQGVNFGGRGGRPGGRRPR